MDITYKWIKEYNNYKKSICSEPKTDYIYHACKFNALQGILSHRYFFATTLSSFDDPNEGRLSLSILPEVDLDFHDAQRAEVQNILNDHVEDVLRELPSYVFCTSQQPDQDFFFNQFHSASADNGTEYQIKICTKTLKDNIWITTENGVKRKNCIRFGKVIYDTDTQLMILKERLTALWSILSNVSYLNDKEKVKYLISNCYYIGTFFKKPDKRNRVSRSEQEFRIAVHTLFKNYEGLDLSEDLPKGDENDHCYIYFNDCIISGITAKTEALRDQMYADPDIKAFLDKNNIVPEVWDRK